LNRADSTPAAASTRFASHSYGRMLRALAARGLHRRAHETPQEFLASVRDHAPQIGEPVARVTSAFCATRYGGAALTEAERDAVESAVATIAAEPRPRG
jgi:hypothetical protein